jgi:hypothetical protein
MTSPSNGAALLAPRSQSEAAEQASPAASAQRANASAARSRTLTDLFQSIVGRPDEQLKPPQRQLYEILQLYARRGIGPRYYLSSGLNGAGIPTSDVLGHVNEREYKRFVHSLNPPADRAPLNSKVEQKRRLIEAGVPTPAPIYTSEQGGAAALANALRAAAGMDVAVKPVSSYGGSGFRRFTIAADGDDIRLDDCDASVSMSATELSTAMPGGLIVEPYVRQHPWYAALNSSSVNTRLSADRPRGVSRRQHDSGRPVRPFVVGWTARGGSGRELGAAPLRRASRQWGANRRHLPTARTGIQAARGAGTRSDERFAIRRR